MAEEDEKKGDGATGRRWCVAVDGSHASHNAFLTCIRLAKPEDYIEVIYASDDQNKDYLPDDLKGRHIQLQYDVALVSRYPKDQYEVNIIDRKGRSARDTVCGYVNSEETDFDILVVGCVGRKGPKLDPTIIGSTADASLRGAHCTAIIARKPPAKKGATFIVGVDGSERAHNGYLLAKDMAKAGDNIVLVHIEEDNKEDELPSEYHTSSIRKRYRDEVAAEAENKETANVELRVLDIPALEESVSDILTKLTHKEQADMLFVGVDGLRRFVKGETSSWGSVSDGIIRKTRHSVCCVQPKGAIYA